MKKSDLKDGMVVELRNGIICIVIGEKMLDSRSHQSFNDYDEDLISHKHSAFDVIKIYEDKRMDCLCDIYINSRLKMLWQRYEIDWSKVPVGTKVLVSDNENNWYEHLFINYIHDEEFKFKAVDIKSRQIHNWKYCKLAEEEVTKGELKKEYLDFMEPESNGYDCDEQEIECLTEWLLDNYNVTRRDVK